MAKAAGALALVVQELNLQMCFVWFRWRFKN